jgi:hypothetical protein
MAVTAPIRVGQIDLQTKIGAIQLPEPKRWNWFISCQSCRTTFGREGQEVEKLCILLLLSAEVFRRHIAWGIRPKVNAIPF